MAAPEVIATRAKDIDPATGKLVEEAIYTNINDKMVVLADSMTLVGRTAAGRGDAAAITVQAPLFLTAANVLGSSGGGGSGDPGPAGPPGHAGPVGPAGPASTVPGPPGSVGPAGPKGDTGAASSVPGPTGPTGPAGPQGVKGDTGAASTVPGPTGPAGPQGDTGATGAASTVPGPAGPQGIQGVKGDTGTQGPQDVKGDTGLTGPAGPTGADSTVPGPTGPQGVKGDTGAQGPKGDTGLTGPPGATAASGVAFTPAGNIAATTVQDAIQELDSEKVAKSGDTMTGMLILPATVPTNANHATNKTYVDSKAGGGFAAGTLMIFQNSAAPTGWTKDTNFNDYALRLVNGNVTAGGVQPFSTAFGRTATDPLSINTSMLAAHFHYGTPRNIIGYSYSNDTGNGYNYSLPDSNITNNEGSNAGHGHGIDLRVKYIDFILARKD